MMSVSYIISKYHKISITITKYLQLVHKNHLFSHKKGRFFKKIHPSNLPGCRLEFGPVWPLSTWALCSQCAKLQRCFGFVGGAAYSFLMTGLGRTIFWRFFGWFCCIWCLELIFFNERLCWNLQRDFVGIFIKFRTFHKRFQKLSSNPKNDAEFLEGNGHWRCQNAKNFKRPRLAFRWALHFYRARGRPRSKQRISSFLPISTRMVSREGCVCFFFFPWKKQPWSGERNVWCLYSMFKNRSCKNTN